MTMPLCSGQIKYLRAISELTEKGETVKCVAIARHLGVSRPSVSKMLHCLADFGLVHEDFCSGVRLTKEGWSTVEEIFHNYDDIFFFFRKILKLPHDVAAEHTMTFIAAYPADTGERLSVAVQKSKKK